MTSKNTDSSSIYVLRQQYLYIDLNIHFARNKAASFEINLFYALK